jgi:hypothetical protein
MAEQEAKWKEDYNALMEENAKLKSTGANTQEWQQRYEAVMKEKDEGMASMQNEKEKLIQLQQMEAATLKEREELSTKLLLKASLTAQRDKERYEAALKERDEAMVRIQREKEEKLMALQQMEEARLKEREEISSQLQKAELEKRNLLQAQIAEQEAKWKEAEQTKLSLLQAQMAEQEAKWKEDYNALMEENAKLKSTGENTQEWQQRYEAAMKEKDEGMASMQNEKEKLNEVVVTTQKDSENLSYFHGAEKTEKIGYQKSSRCCVDDFINGESKFSDKDYAPQCADDVENEEMDAEAGSNLVAADKASDIVQNKKQRRYIIIILFTLVIVVVAVAVPIGLKKSKENSYTAQSKFICGRSINLDLTDASTWPTPPTPTLFEADYDLDSIVLIKRDDPFGSIGIQLNSFFRAFDLSYDTRLPLYITQDNWFFLSGFFKLFLGGFYKDEEFWAMLERIFRAKIVENEVVLVREGKSWDYISPEALNGYFGDELVDIQIRNHRDTVIRKLFQYPTLTGKADDVCTLINSEGNSKKYTVVHLSDEKTNSFLSEFNNSTGINHSAAVEMSPEYVKSFLGPLNMLENDIYPIATGEYNALDTSISDRVEALLRDDILGDLIRLPTQNRHLGSVLYFAVLADVYIGNPVDHNSMWIARMRCALGLSSKTFILTKPTMTNSKRVWITYLNEDNYLELYDREKLGLWSG